MPDDRLDVAEVAHNVWASFASPSWWAIVAALVLGIVAAGVGAGYERTRPALYQSSAVILFDNPAAIAANGATITAVSQIRGKYAGLLPTDVIGVPVAEKTHLPLGVIESSVQGVYSAANLDFGVVASSRDPATARTIAAATAEELVSYVAHEQASLPASLPATIRLKASIVRPASPAARVAPTRRKELVTGAIAGITVLVLTYLVAQALTGLGLRPPRRTVAG